MKNKDDIYVLVIALAIIGALYFALKFNGFVP